MASEAPKVWVVTGGIATGKSAAMGIFRRELPRGAFFDADQVVQGLLRDAEVIAKIRSVFGDKVADSQGQLDRSVLRALIFGDDERRHRMEAILHPRVRQRFHLSLDQASIAGASILVAEIPLYFETGQIYQADEVLVVAASEVTQRRRIAERNRWPDAMVDEVLAAQWPVGAKVAKATRVLWNEGSPEVLGRQIRRWLKLNKAAL